MPEKLAVTICATEKYQYAMRPQARALHANLRHLQIPLVIVLVGDRGIDEIAGYYEHLFKREKPDFEVVKNLKFKQEHGGQNYKNQAQLLIASMRTAAFTAARTAGATHCWSLDSDVIPKSAECYRTLRWILDMPNSYYEAAVAPYPSQGGGDMLTGRGVPEQPIFEDYREEERVLPEDLQKELAAHRATCAAVKSPHGPPPELLKKGEELRQRVQQYAPRANVFQLNGSGWRRRGWLSAAYPALGRGVVVPTDWCGFGCTLLGPRALDEVDFTGYDGGGTEDLFAIFWRWHQSGIRIGAALHEPAFHVSRRSDGEFFVSMIRFVTEADESKGECVGHMRVIHKPYYGFEPGELYDEKNDGNPQTPEQRAAAEKQRLEAEAKAEADRKAAEEKAKAPEAPPATPPEPPAAAPTP